LRLPLFARFARWKKENGQPLRGFKWKREEQECGLSPFSFFPFPFSCLTNCRFS
jgi:hypothetical protein